MKIICFINFVRNVLIMVSSAQNVQFLPETLLSRKITFNGVIVDQFFYLN